MYKAVSGRDAQIRRHRRRARREEEQRCEATKLGRCRRGGSNWIKLSLPIKLPVRLHIFNADVSAFLLYVVNCIASYYRLISTQINNRNFYRCKIIHARSIHTTTVRHYGGVGIQILQHLSSANLF